jgi:site-specific recombinase XerD
MVVDHHALLHPAGGQETRHQETSDLAHLRRTYTTLLHANGEDVKVLQELLRHSSSRITMDIYAQVQMPAKRAAQQKVVAMVRVEKPPGEAKKMA